jgi:MFS family permease
LAGLYNGRRENGNRLGIKKYPWYILIFTVLLFLSAILQTTCLSFFGSVPMLTLALCCAIGFLCGEKLGAIMGILGGVLTDALGGAGAYFSPILFLLCGYFCGALVGWFLSENLPSFLIYSLFAGVLRLFFTFILCGLYSEKFDIAFIFTKILIPEFFGYLICVIPAYGVVIAVRAMVDGKSSRKGRGF